MARILIIDDDEELLFALEQSLVAAGHTVVTAADGTAAAKLLRSEYFELVITDIVMPNREGIETIIALRRTHPETGVIAMSGGVSRSKLYLELASRLGAHCTLAKPFPPQKLHEAVATVLSQGKH